MKTIVKRPRTGRVVRRQAGSGRFASIAEYISYQLETPARRRAYLKRIGYERNPKTGEIVIHSV